MKKEKIVDAAVISASALIGSEAVRSLDEIVEIVSVDPVPSVYGPPPEFMEDEALTQIYDEEPIDDVLCVYGPPPEVI